RGTGVVHPLQVAGRIVLVGPHVALDRGAVVETQVPGAANGAGCAGPVVVLQQRLVHPAGRADQLVGDVVGVRRLGGDGHPGDDRTGRALRPVLPAYHVAGRVVGVGEVLHGGRAAAGGRAPGLAGFRVELADQLDTVAQQRPTALPERGQL